MHWLTDSTHGAMLVLLFGLAVGLLVYLTPSLLAWALGAQHWKRILLLNLLLGWTVLGWMGALLWTLLDQDRTEARE